MVVQGDDKSNFENICIGVPQGSVLGPFLFIIAVNDFPSNIPCKSVLYADDTTLLNKSEDIERLLSQESQSLNAALEWFKSNSLVVNSNKTESIIFSLDHNIYNTIKPVKLLGFFIDSRLSWSAHIDYLCTKLARVSYLIRKLKYNVTNEMLIAAYYAFFHSHLTYGITLWGNSTTSSKIFVWQKKVLRIIKGVKDQESCFPIFKQFSILPFPCIYIYRCLINVKEKLTFYSVRKDFHQYPTRKNYLLDIFCTRLQTTKNSHICMQIKLFNKLPETAWTVDNKKFKNVLDRWLRDKCFYSVDEFLGCDLSSLHF